MRLLAVIFVLFSVGCAVAATPPAPSSDTTLQGFQFIQKGRVIPPDHGVVRLSPGVFSLRYAGGGRVPSIFVGANPQVKQQFPALHQPLLAMPGSGTAAYPGQMIVESDPLELYEGWTAAFDTAWGGVFSATDREVFEEIRKKSPTVPQLFMTGRNYSNFVVQADGSSLFQVARLNGTVLPTVEYGSLYALLFTEEPLPAGESRPVELRWVPCVIEFQGDAGKR